MGHNFNSKYSFWRSDNVLNKIDLPQDSNLAMFLDFDGTLVEIASRPDAINVPNYLTELLTSLNNLLGGSLAILTGRSISNLLDHLDIKDICVVGGHGAEFLINRSIYRRVSEPIPLYFIYASNNISNKFEGVELEFKHSSISFHYRNNPTIEYLLADEIINILGKYPSNYYKLMSGHKVYEISPKNVSKGIAVKKLMALPPFNHCRPIVIGDDLTDETAFAVLDEYNGLALRVKSDQFPQEIADFSGPSQVIDWLNIFIRNRLMNAK